MPRLKVPAALASGNSTETVEVEADSLGELFENHAAEHGPALRDSVVADGELKEYINVYVDGSEAESLDESLDDDALIRVMPAASGGSV